MLNKLLQAATITLLLSIVANSGGLTTYQPARTTEVSPAKSMDTSLQQIFVWKKQLGNLMHAMIDNV